VPGLVTTSMPEPLAVSAGGVIVKGCTDWVPAPVNVSVCGGEVAPSASAQW
jgi:hypothetical protein